MAEISVEQQARDMLERLGVDGAQYLTASDLVEIANVVNDSNAYRALGRPPVEPSARSVQKMCTGSMAGGRVRLTNGVRQVQCTGCNEWLDAPKGFAPIHAESAAWYPGCDDGGYR